ncbi:MAG: TylF/MycF/NovP-related O-methyltransferase, partial [Geminicoccaceae bacterium]
KAGNLLVNEARFRSAVGSAIDQLLQRNGDDELGDYLEFGVYNGSTLAIMHDLLARRGRTTSRLFGFDSFEGLPQEANVDDNNIWMPGQYRCPETFARNFLTKRGIDWQRVALIKGWFSDSCTPATRAQHQMKKAGIIMIDSDLYSSAVEALNFCEPLIGRHALIIFDEYYPGGRDDRFLGEEKAFAEFLEANPDITSTKLDENYSFGSRMFLLERSTSG